MIHELKTIQPYFDRVWNLEKTFEVRFNDRGFQKSDKVVLLEYDHKTEEYSGRKIEGEILYVLGDFDAIKKGYVVFSLQVNNCIS